VSRSYLFFYYSIMETRIDKSCFYRPEGSNISNINSLKQVNMLERGRHLLEKHVPTHITFLCINEFFWIYKWKACKF